jgi:RNA polymerase sigma-70 factor (ECF subfamily)
MMAGDASGDDDEKARRFRDAALPYLDDVYTLARYLLRNAADAEDAVQECYLRALRHFDTFRVRSLMSAVGGVKRICCERD